MVTSPRNNAIIMPKSIAKHVLPLEGKIEVHECLKQKFTCLLLFVLVRHHISGDQLIGNIGMDYHRITGKMINLKFSVYDSNRSSNI